MSDTIVFLSTARLTEDDFADFLSGIGGVMDPGMRNRGRVSEDACHAWLFFAPEAVGEVMEESGEAVTRVLGGPPASAIVAELSSIPNGRPVAFKAALAFAARWPRALIEVDDELMVASVTHPGEFEPA